VHLSDDDKAVLDFERLRWHHPGAKESAIVERFGYLAVRHYQRVNALLDHPGAMAYDAQLVRRLQRLRDARARQRSASPAPPGAAERGSR
jgi:hypothetical protein